MQGITRLVRASDPRRVWADFEDQPREAVDIGDTAERQRELDWLRTYQRELEYRLRAVELDADILGRQQRQRTRAAGHD